MPYLAKFNLIKEKKYEKRKNNFLYHTFIRRHQSLTFKYEYIIHHIVVTILQWDSKPSTKILSPF